MSKPHAFKLKKKINKSRALLLNSISIIAEHFRYSCLLGSLTPVRGGLSTCVQGPLAISRRGEI